MSIGKGFRKEVGGSRYVDVSVYEGKYKVKVLMSLWEKGNPCAIIFEDREYVLWEKVIPLFDKRVEKWLRRLFNNQSQRVCGEDLF